MASTKSRKSKYFFTSESVTEGHPDKLCDQISDAILDSILEKDPDGRVACETMVTTGLAMVAGEITTSCYVEIPKVIRETIRSVGYTNPEFGYDYQNCGVLTAIQEQSPDISMGVDTGGAGDQGMMFGYAVNDTPELMPMPISLAHKLSRRLAKIRKNKMVNYLRPDGKTQVTIEYVDGKPVRVDTIVVSAHHSPGAKMDKIQRDIKELVIKPIVPKNMIDKKTKIFVNPTGRFEVGGPAADTGLTGRKIIVDTYGGLGLHGGGAFSGKDPSKVDRSAAYMARYIAKNIVASGVADRCELQLSYAIGVAEPMSLNVTTYGTGKVSQTKLEKIVRENFDLTPRGIINALKLKSPVYRRTAAYGHFGRDEEGFTWEQTNMAELIKREANR